MRIFKTQINPNAFNEQIGSLNEIYTTTLSTPASFLLIFSIGFSFYFAGLYISLKLLIWLLPIFIILNPRFCYISIHENGVIFKRRFSYKILRLEDIENIKLSNMSFIWNSFRSQRNKVYSIDIYLKNGNKYSYSERVRIFNSFKFLRVDSLTRVVGVLKVFEELEKRIKTAPNKGFKLCQ